jgi:putative metallohydrolase (TIGR04338 family)
MTSSQRPRDWARSGVYAGENQVARLLDRAADFPIVEVAGSRITVPPERHFGDLPGVQRYVDAVLALDWVVRRWPGPAAVPVTVRERRGATKAHYAFDPAAGRGTIAVPVRGFDSRWALRELVVLHEIAHHLTSPDVGHGPDFTACLLALADGVMGAEIALLLRVAWADQGVPVG